MTHGETKWLKEDELRAGLQIKTSLWDSAREGLEVARALGKQEKNVDLFLKCFTNNRIQWSNSEKVDSYMR